MTFAFYNEIDEQAAEWIRELIKLKVITDGVVDNRSIVDVVPSDLKGFSRCHFFAGIACWDYALNQAGYDGDGVVFSASLPCQPFSDAGAGKGFEDERHLWPVFFELFKACRPDVLFGEQVSSKDALIWYDVVKADLNSIGYPVVAMDIPASLVGGPHRRQRLYFCAENPNANKSIRLRERSGKGIAGANAFSLEAQNRRNGKYLVPAYVEVEKDAEPQHDPGGQSNAAEGRIDSVADAAESRCQDERKHRSGWSSLPARFEQRGNAVINPDSEHTKRRPKHEEYREGHGRNGSGRSSHALSGSNSKRNGRRSDLAGREEEGRTTDGRNSAVSDLCDTERRGLGITRSASGSSGRSEQSGKAGDGGNACSQGLQKRERIGRIQRKTVGSCPRQTVECASDTLNPEQLRLEGHTGDGRDEHGFRWLDAQQARSASAAGATRGFWGDCDWWLGRDERARPIGRGIRPLVGTVKSSLQRVAPIASLDLVQGGNSCAPEIETENNPEARNMRLRGYGNSLTASAAIAFIETYLESCLKS